MTMPDDYIAAYLTKWAPDLVRSALLLIDLQYATGSRDGALGRKMRAEGSTVADYRFARIESSVVPNTRRLLAGFRRAGRPAVFITSGAGTPEALDAPLHMRKMLSELGNYVGSREHEVLGEVKPQAGEHVVRKATVGAFASTGIDSLMRALGCEQLYLVGISTNMCVETTAREAADRGYLVTLVEDACGATHADLHNSTMRNFRRLFGRVCSTQEVLGELELRCHA